CLAHRQRRGRLDLCAVAVLAVTVRMMAAVIRVTAGMETVVATTIMDTDAADTMGAKSSQSAYGSVHESCLAQTGCCIYFAKSSPPSAANLSISASLIGF